MLRCHSGPYEPTSYLFVLSCEGGGRSFPEQSISFAQMHSSQYVDYPQCDPLPSALTYICVQGVPGEAEREGKEEPVVAEHSGDFLSYLFFLSLLSLFLSGPILLLSDLFTSPSLGP